MTRRAHILSFDEVRASDGRHAHARPTTSGQHRRSAPAHSDRYSAALGDSSHRATHSSSPSALRDRRMGSTAGVSAPSRMHQTKSHGASHAACHPIDARVRHANEDMAQTIRKRFRTAKADRAFDRQFGDADRRQVTEGGSRAAVYNMRMGAAQRRSARMQAQGKDKKSFGVAFPSLPNLSLATTRVLAVTFVLVFAVFMIFPPCQSLYNQTRQLQQLQAEYDELVAYNQQIQGQIDYLNSDEGIEDYARSELGLIRSDEQVATVEGVESSADESSASDVGAVPASGSVKAPDTWYSGVLDVVFGYGA